MRGKVIYNLESWYHITWDAALEITKLTSCFLVFTFHHLSYSCIKKVACVDFTNTSSLSLSLSFNLFHIMTCKQLVHMAHGCNYIAAFVNNNNVTLLVITFISMKYKTVVTNNQKKTRSLWSLLLVLLEWVPLNLMFHHLTKFQLKEECSGKFLLQFHSSNQNILSKEIECFIFPSLVWSLWFPFQ